jgi:hypothetical protein
MLEIAFGVLTKSDGDIIGETLGAYQYMYFTFLERFRREPRELDDLIDGLIYIELNAYIERVDAIRECFKDYVLDGVELTVGGVTVDLDVEQGEQETIVTFARCGGTIHRGMMPCCEYVAEVVIPPRRYEAVAVEAPDTAGESGTMLASRALALDTDAVILRLWPGTEPGETEEGGKIC